MSRLTMADLGKLPERYQAQIRRAVLHDTPLESQGEPPKRQALAPVVAMAGSEGRHAANREISPSGAADALMGVFGMKRAPKSQHPDAFCRCCEAAGLPHPVREHRFHAPRRWRMDYAWPTFRLAVEVQGGIWTQGRHVRGAALLKEWEKLNAAASNGWRILYFQPRDLLNRETLESVKKALTYRSEL